MADSCYAESTIRKTIKEYSSCVGDAANTCGGFDYKDHSVCYANTKNACAGGWPIGNTNTYDDTSYCASENGFCPVGARKQDGNTWQLCEGETTGGKTC